MGAFVFYEKKLNCKLVHAIEHICESALLSCSVVFVKNTVSNSLVNLLNSLLVGFLSKSFVTSSNSGFIFLEVGLKRSLYHFVLKSFCFNNFNALFRGLDIRHRLHLLVNLIRSGDRHERVAMILFLSALLYYHITYSDK